MQESESRDGQEFIMPSWEDLARSLGQSLYQELQQCLDMTPMISLTKLGENGVQLMNDMSKVTIKRDGGVTIEADLTFEQIKELTGVNGYAPAKSATVTLIEAKQGPNVATFFDSLSEKGKTFVDLLRSAPEGIEAYALANLLAFNSPRQVGGLTGGSVAKLAKKYGISIKDVYQSKVSFPEGKRTRIFYPGRLLERNKAR